MSILLSVFGENVTLLVPTIDEYDVWGSGTTYTEMPVNGVLVGPAEANQQEAPLQYYRDGSIRVHFPKTFTQDLAGTKLVRKNKTYKFQSEDSYTVSQRMTFDRNAIFELVEE